MIGAASVSPVTACPGVQALPNRVVRHGRHASRAKAQWWRVVDPANADVLRQWVDEDHGRARANLPRWHRGKATEAKATVEFRETEQYQEMRADTGRALVWEYDEVKKRPVAVRKGTSSRACWSSRGVFVKVYVPQRLAMPDAPAILREEGVDPDTFKRWVEAETGYADKRTGRGVMVRPHTVRTLMQVHVRTVQRCRAAARRLGLYATIYTGRMLKIEEVWPLRGQGSPQRGETAESAFVIPKCLRRLWTMSYLPSGLAKGQIPSEGNPQLTLSPKGKKEQTSSALNVKERLRGRPGWKLACEVIERLSWACEAHPREFVGLLHRFATAARPWTVDDVLRHIEVVDRRRGWTTIRFASELTAPAYGMLNKYLRDAHEENDHPRLDVFLGIGDLSPREYAQRVARQQVTDPRRIETLATHIEARVRHERGHRCDREGCCA